MKTGRPKGSKDRAPRVTPARKQAAAANAAGISPLDVILTTMRDQWDAAELEADVSKKAMMRLTACNIAERAAPYCHARLANTTVNATIRRSLSDFSDAELAAITDEGASSERAAEPSGRPH